MKYSHRLRNVEFDQLFGGIIFLTELVFRKLTDREDFVGGIALIREFPMSKEKTFPRPHQSREQLSSKSLEKGILLVAFLHMYSVKHRWTFRT